MCPSGLLDVFKLGPKNKHSKRRQWELQHLGDLVFEVSVVITETAPLRLKETKTVPHANGTVATPCLLVCKRPEHRFSLVCGRDDNRHRCGPGS